MTHLDDLCEPGDDREPEPCDWYEAPEPLDLDAIDEACCIYLNGDDKAKAKAASFLLSSVQALVADNRVARQRIAEFEALPTREEWAVTPSSTQVPQEFDFRFPDGLAAEEAAKRQGRQMWRRQSSVRSWEPIELDAPF